MFILLFFIVLSFYKRIENNTNMPISDIVKRRLGTNPRRRFLLWHQSGHFTAKPPAKKQVFVQYLFGGGEGSRTPVRNRIPANVYEHMPPIKFPIVNSDGRKRTTGSFINAEPPQSLSGSVPCADRRAGGPDLMTLIAGGTGDRRVNAAALSSLQRSIISCV